MARLTALSNELIDLLLPDLSIHDIHSLCLTCRSLNTAVTPALYKSITLGWFRIISAFGEATPQIRKSRIEVLLRTLLQNPKLVTFVKSLELNADNILIDGSDVNSECAGAISGIELSDEDKKLFRAAIEDLQVSGEDEIKWKAALEHRANRDAVIALLVGLCTHLKSLVISQELLVENDWMSLLIKNSLGVATNDAKLLRNLSLARVENHREDDAAGDLTLALQSKLLCFFYLPKVQTLEISSLSDLDANAEENGWISHNIYATPARTWPLRNAPLAVNLTTLRLLQSSVHPKTLSFILKQMPNLHTVELDVRHAIYDDPANFDVVREALSHLRNTLCCLTLHNKFFKIDPRHGMFANLHGSLGPLHEFSALTSLTVSLVALCGSMDDNDKSMPMLAEHLPRGLENLTITDELYVHTSPFPQYSDTITMQIFRCYFTGERLSMNGIPGSDYKQAIWETSGDVPGWETATPGLKQFVYDTRTHSEQSQGYSEDGLFVQDLKRIVEGQGLECTIVF